MTKGRPQTKQSRLTARRKRRQLNAVVDKLIAASEASSDPANIPSFTELIESLTARPR